jgi:hypothetical protein
MSSLLGLINTDGSPTCPKVKVGAPVKDRRRRFTTEVCTNTYRPITSVIESDTGQSLQRIWQKHEQSKNISHSNDLECWLCDDCRDINFEHIAHVTRGNIPEQGVPVAYLGHRLSRKTATRCYTCRLFETVRNSYDGKYTQQLRAYNRDIASSGNESRLLEKKRVPFLAVIRANNRISYDEEVFTNEIGKRGVLVPMNHQLPPAVDIHSVDPSRIDFELLASWISTCKSLHTNCHRSTTHRKHFMGIRAIDCLTEKIVSIELTQEYVALSYVWGAAAPGLASSDSSKKQTTASFQVSTAPLTIRDAMTVVKRLGKRYLWVDKYCVSQHKSMERHEALQNMDLIYENSVATIIALHGTNDEAGLPGVSNAHRQSQPRYDYGSGCLISTLPRLSSVIAKSAWATRGWTYQEARLSKRCLFFTDYQVYFVCGEGTISETIRGGPTTSSVAALLNNTYLNEALFAKDQPEHHTGLLGDRLTFSQRHLTYDSDALNAFRGFLARSNLVSFWGVSIVPMDSGLDPDIGLALGLMWRKRSKRSLFRSKFRKHEEQYYTRRIGGQFPTWSWASVKGEICHETTPYNTANSTVWAYLHGDKAFGSLTAFSPKFSLVSTTGEVRSLHSILANTMSSIIPEISSSLYVDGEVVRVRLFQASFNSSIRENARFIFCDDDLKDIPGIDGGMTQDMQDPDISDQLPRDYDGDECKNSAPTKRYEEALILLDGAELDFRNVKFQRLVMMLLKWTGPNRAERAGLLSSLACDIWDVNFVKRIPRTRRQFELV